MASPAHWLRAIALHTLVANVSVEGSNCLTCCQQEGLLRQGLVCSLGGLVLQSIQPPSFPTAVFCITMSTAEQLRERLALQPHPEGGFYRQTWQSAAHNADGRALASSILFLLPRGVRSHWHRTDGEEIWIHQAGDPLSLHIAERGQVSTHVVSIEHKPQVVVPANAWQSAQSNGDWTLVCCVVAPAFEFDTFEMAPPDWDPQSETTHS